jgi:2-polyprenyl-3-methyl-5-hydroxy-6-metoxy-1,4-benzoquinol methylase
VAQAEIKDLLPRGTQTSPRLAEALQRTTYRRPHLVKRLNWVLRTIESRAEEHDTAMSDMRVVDVGCGHGSITLPLAALGCRVDGVDLLESNIAKARRDAESQGADNVSFHQGDAMAFGDDDAYDVVIASEIIQVIPAPERFVANLARIVKPGGWVILTSTNGYGPYELGTRALFFARRRNTLRRLLGKPPFKPGEAPERVQFFTRGQLLDMAADNNLKCREVTSSDSIFAALPPQLYNSSQRLGRINVALADRLPAAVASGWYFLLADDR